jgi:hypothetical protein
MEKLDYNVSITVDTTPEEAFKRINNVSKWWATKEFNGKFEGLSTNLHDEFIVEFGDTHYSKHKLVEVIPNKKVVWLVTDSKLNWIENDKFEWTNTKMIFEIIPKGNKTTIHFTHEGLVPGQECYDNCVKGWDAIIKQNLFNYMTDDKKFLI